MLEMSQVSIIFRNEISVVRTINFFNNSMDDKSTRLKCESIIVAEFEILGCNDEHGLQCTCLTNC